MPRYLWPFVALFALASTGCALGLGKSVHQYAFLDAEDGAQGRKIEVEQLQHVVIGTSDTDFSDLAYHKLLAQCPNGRIVRVAARHSTRLGILAYDNVMRMTGVCLTN